ncbi:MAG: TRAM domain-containing protein [Actinomycetaceae bacterium]|nr:TRAM domain-containing protein [Actinomycetaceae bacterium]
MSTLRLKDRPAHGGFCVGIREDGKVVMVHGALPGEKVGVRLTQETSKVAFAEVIEVLEASPDRVEHPWESAGSLGVGGADLGHVSLEGQLIWKAQVIEDTLRRIGGVELAGAFQGDKRVEVHSLDRTSGEDFGRRRLEFVISEGEKPAMYRAGTHDLVEVPDMPFAVPALEDLHIFGDDTRWNFRPGQRLKAVLPSACDPVLCIDKQAFGQDGKKAPRHVNEAVRWQDTEIRYRVRPESFWQAHSHAPSVLVDAVMSMAQVETGDTVTELFAGSGLFTVPLGLCAGETGRIASLEAARAAVSDAVANMRTNGVQAAYDLRVASVNAKEIRLLAPFMEGGVTVLDPPRVGAKRGVIQEILQAKPRRVVMVSCDPAAMSRDLRAALEFGYAPRSYLALDLFPYTHHVEVVTCLEPTS